MKKHIFAANLLPNIIMTLKTSLISFILSLFIIIFLPGCKSNEIIMKPNPKKGEANKGNQEGRNVDYDEAVARHFEMQSESTKQMMLKSDKMRKSKNAGISRVWYDKLFNNSCFKNSAMVKTGHTNMSITKRESCFLKY